MDGTIKNYDVIVIGSGNGGLTAAIRVLQAGRSCLLVEKHNLPGGFATSFKRGRFEFEASLHELNDFGSAQDPGDIRTLFRSLGVEDKIVWIRIPEAYHSQGLRPSTRRHDAPEASGSPRRTP